MLVLILADETIRLMSDESLSKDSRGQFNYDEGIQHLKAQCRQKHKMLTSYVGRNADSYVTTGSEMDELFSLVKPRG